jgi:hypothetical protein
MQSMGAAAASFKRVLRKRGVSLAATEVVPPPPGLTVAGPLVEPLTADTMRAIIARHPGVRAIVSFAGVPQLKDQDLEDWSQFAPKLVTVGAHDPDNRLKRIFRRRIIAFAILPRLDAAPKAAKKPATEREWFDQNFQLVTSATKLP